MVAVTRRVKPARMDQSVKDELLKRILESSEGNAEKWASAAQTGATDAELKELLAQCVGTGGCSDPELGSVCSSETFGHPIWFGSVTPLSRAPDLSGQKLIDAVRRVYGIELPQGTNGRHPANGKHHIAGDVPPGMTSSVTPDGAQINQVDRLPTKGRGKHAAAKPALPISTSHVVEEIDIPIGKIKPSPENPREDFDSGFLDELGQSLLEHGQLTPLRVRTPNVDGMYEIIDGETRWRAAKQKGVKSLRCQVVECTDAEAALERLLSYRQRRDLNPIEEARGLKLLLDKYECSQRELEQTIKLSQGQISNRLRLLKLPTAWQNRVISREITASDARDLAAWSDVPQIFAHLDKAIKREKAGFDLADSLRQAACQESEELSGYDWQSGVNWKLDSGKPEVWQALQIRDVPMWGGKTERRAFNVKLAQQMKADLIAKLKEKKAKSAERAEASAKRADLSPAERKRKAEQLREQQRKKIYRYKVAWLQQRLLQVFDEGCIQITTPLLITWTLWFATQCENGYQRCDELNDVLSTKLDELDELRKYASDIDNAGPLLRAVLRKWLEHSFEGCRTDLSAEAIESFADQAGIDLKKEWRVEEAFLELFTKDGLIDLVNEWKLGMYFVEKKKGAIVGSSTLANLKRGDLIKKILEVGKHVKVPEQLLKLKGGSL